MIADFGKVSLNQLIVRSMATAVITSILPGANLAALAEEHQLATSSSVYLR